jgi:5-formyltetrahydrofolate cyclo-ligase
MDYGRPLHMKDTKSDTDSAKRDMRKQMLGIRRALSLEQKVAADRRIAEQLLGRVEVAAAQTICIYLSLSEEVDTKFIIAELFARKKTVVVPKVVGVHLELEAITTLDDLNVGAFGILEPTSSARAAHSPDVDLYIVPGIAFDEEGFRVGWGKGYYDKLLAGTSVPRIGLAYTVQLIAQVPHTSYDVPMTVVITDKRIIEL